MKKPTQTHTQALQLQHGSVFNIDTPRNSVVAVVGGHRGQPFNQGANSTEFGVSNVQMKITRIRLVMHDACLLAVKNGNSSLGPFMANTLAADELYFYKRNVGVISNA
jgi:hypothetical protein